MTPIAAYYDAVSKLSSDQLDKLEVLKWLVSLDNKDRRTGRTYLLSLAFLWEAIRTRETVKVWDHVHYHSARSDITGLIMDMIRRPNGIHGYGGCSAGEVNVDSHWADEKLDNKTRAMYYEYHEKPDLLEAVQMLTRASFCHKNRDWEEEIQSAIRTARRYGHKVKEIRSAINIEIIRFVMKR